MLAQSLAATTTRRRSRSCGSCGRDRAVIVRSSCGHRPHLQWEWESECDSAFQKRTCRGGLRPPESSPSGTCRHRPTVGKELRKRALRPKLLPSYCRGDRCGLRPYKLDSCSHRLHLQWEKNFRIVQSARIKNFRNFFLLTVGAVYDRPNQDRALVQYPALNLARLLRSKFGQARRSPW